MPQSPRLVLGCLLVLFGLTLLAVAALGLRRRLPRNRWIGVRTPASLRTDAAFAAANQVAAAPLGAAGVISVAGGAALLAGAGGGLGWVLLVVSLVGTFVLAGFAGIAGDRAATTMTATPAPSPCSGTCAGCDLVAGCRDAAPTHAPSEAPGSS